MSINPPIAEQQQLLDTLDRKSFTGAYLAVGSLQRLYQDRPALADEGSVAALGRLIQTARFSRRRQAFFLYVLAESGKDIGEEADALVDAHRGLLDPYAKALLILAVLVLPGLMCQCASMSPEGSTDAEKRAFIDKEASRILEDLRQPQQLVSGIGDSFVRMSAQTNEQTARLGQREIEDGHDFV